MYVDRSRERSSYANSDKDQPLSDSISTGNSETYANTGGEGGYQQPAYRNLLYDDLLKIRESPEIQNDLNIQSISESGVGIRGLQTDNFPNSFTERPRSPLQYPFGTGTHQGADRGAASVSGPNVANGLQNIYNSRVYATNQQASNGQAANQETQFILAETPVRATEQILPSRYQQERITSNYQHLLPTSYLSRYGKDYMHKEELKRNKLPFGFINVPSEFTEKQGSVPFRETYSQIPPRDYPLSLSASHQPRKVISESTGAVNDPRHNYREDRYQSGDYQTSLVYQQHGRTYLMPGQGVLHSGDDKDVHIHLYMLPK